MEDFEILGKERVEQIYEGAPDLSKAEVDLLMQRAVCRMSIFTDYPSVVEISISLGFGLLCVFLSSRIENRTCTNCCGITALAATFGYLAGGVICNLAINRRLKNVDAFLKSEGIMK